MLPRSGVPVYWHFIIRHHPIATPGAVSQNPVGSDQSQSRISGKLFHIEIEVQRWLNADHLRGVRLTMPRSRLSIWYSKQKKCPAEFFNFFCHLSGQVLGKDMLEVWGVGAF